MVKRKSSWKDYLGTDLTIQMRELGNLLRISRKRQGRTQLVIANLLGVDPRIVANIEKGFPEVSVGIYFNYLNVLGLFNEMKVIFSPELDMSSLEEEIKKQRKSKRKRKVIPDSKVSF